ncbi:MAG TPA: DJ-1/PfpI family protein [Cerasibacillus sp.]|uniref:DJ-1/PfpI family protein n=1 Tax=Cerasibacillus sp. TaxID=2498711 RepID=UPI002F41CE53
MKKALLLVYDDYADFQIGHLLFFLKKKGHYHVLTGSVEGKDVVSLGGLSVKPDLPLSGINIEKFDLVILPGGDTFDPLLNNEALINFLKIVYSLSIPIASICGSAVLLGKAGLLNNKKFTCNEHTFNQYKEHFSNATYTGERVELDGNVITAKGSSFSYFTIAVGDFLNLWRNEEEARHALAFCKGE